jgi:hypothetical protein
LGLLRLAYLFENRQLREPVRVFKHMCGAAGKTPVWFAWILAVLLLVSGGVAYRVSGHKLNLLGEKPTALPVPLSDFPIQFGNWVGSEMSIPTTTREYMERNFADDFFSRRYINSADKIWVDIYVVYCSTKPGGMLGHRPSVCYPANGWLQETTEKSQFTSQKGRQIDCLVQRFRQPAPAIGEVVVLNFYVRNGQITTNESDFEGLLGRKFNIARDSSRYVAQIQISSVLESSVRKAAGEITDIILDFLPDENGEVSAAESIQPPSGKVKSTK